MSSKRKWIACASMLMAAPVICEAVPIAYDSFGGTVIDFNGLAGSPTLGAGEVLTNQYAALGVTFSVANYAAYASTSVAAIATQNSDPTAIWVDQGGGGSAGALGMVIDFSTAHSQVGVFMWGSASSTFTLSVYNGDTLLDSITSPFGPSSTGYPEGFLALSSSNITRAVVYSTSLRTDIPGTAGANWNFSIDDLKFDSPVSVPEPGTLGLLGLGFVGALFRRRRRTL